MDTGWNAFEDPEVVREVKDAGELETCDQYVVIEGTYLHCQLIHNPGDLDRTHKSQTYSDTNMKRVLVQWQ